MVAENKHYVTIWVACEMVDNQAVAEVSIWKSIMISCLFPEVTLSES